MVEQEDAATESAPLLAPLSTKERSSRCCDITDVQPTAAREPGSRMCVAPVPWDSGTCHCGWPGVPWELMPGREWEKE